MEVQRNERARYIILRIGNLQVQSIEDLLGEIHSRKDGEEVEIIVYRRGFE